MEAKGHGSAKHFKQVYVTLAGIMRAMVNGKDIFVQHVWIKVRLSIMLKKIVTELRSQKTSIGNDSNESHPSDFETGKNVYKNFVPDMSTLHIAILLLLSLYWLCQNAKLLKFFVVR